MHSALFHFDRLLDFPDLHEEEHMRCCFLTFTCNRLKHLITVCAIGLRTNELGSVPAGRTSGVLWFSQ